MQISVPGLESGDETLWFRTGHGRLYWRVKETPHEEPETNEWIGTFKNSDVLIDIGANIGLYTIAAAKLRGCTVIAIEPDLMNARLLYENCLKNDVGDRVNILPIAIDSRSHVAEFHLKTLSYGDALHSLHRVSTYVRKPSGLVARIPAFTIQDLFTMLDLPKPTRVKIDVDGRESDVLESFGPVLDTVSEIMVEVDPSQSTSSQIEFLMRNSGFQLKRQGTASVAWSASVNRLYARASSQD
jgi:FkbM family methyltransferase